MRDSMDQHLQELLTARAKKAETALERAVADGAALRRALERCLIRETAHAKVAGFGDCTCINFSREAETEYETGQCPHQIARQTLSTDHPGARIQAVVTAALGYVRASREQENNKDPRVGEALLVLVRACNRLDGDK